MLQCGELDESGYFVTVRGGHDCDRPSSENSDEENPEKGREPELKLWICDILNINKSWDKNTNNYIFCGIPVNTIDVYAVITSVLQNKFGVIYKVDDGTGEICCWHSRHSMEDCEGLKKNLSAVMENILISSTATMNNDTWLSSSEPDQDEALPSNSGIAQVAHWMKEQILAYSETSSNTLQVGNTVQIRGKLSDFRNERCIIIYNIRPVYDINEERIEGLS
uniref:CST complex subunit STN1 n=1 Tax=Cuerna arida TaxID=1464854 RepID=A0A1B6F0C9_9HEMI